MKSIHPVRAFRALFNSSPAPHARVVPGSPTTNGQPLPDPNPSHAGLHSRPVHLTNAVPQVMAPRNQEPLRQVVGRREPFAPAGGGTGLEGGPLPMRGSSLSESSYSSATDDGHKHSIFHALGLMGDSSPEVSSRWSVQEGDGGATPPSPGTVLPGPNEPHPLELQTPPQPRRSTKGFFKGVQRALRANPPTLQLSPFVNIKEVRPTPARAPQDFPDGLRSHQEGAQAPSALAAKIGSTAGVVAGRVAGAVPDAGPALGSRASAVDEVVQMFSAPVAARQHTHRREELLALAQAQALPEALAERLSALAGEHDTHLIRITSAACALAEVTGGDAGRALAALDALADPQASRAAQADAFALQRNLARTSLGFEALLALQPSLLPAGDDAYNGLIRREAAMYMLQAADQVMAGLPPGHRVPQNPQEALQAALALLPGELRTRGLAPRLGARRPAAGGDLLAAKALVCAAELHADPAAMPDSQLRSAYLGWRNGNTSEAPGSDLDKMQSRLFKLTTYAQRASQGSSKNFLQRVLGLGKSPLSALPLGTAGARLRNPEDDFKTLAVVDTMVARLNGQIAECMAAHDGSLDALRQAVPKAVRVAAACQYKDTIGRKGWRDEVKVGSSMRKHIAANAAQALGVDVALVRQSPEFKALRKIDPDILRSWADEERLGAGPGGELDRQLEQLQKLDHNGDSFPPGATPDQVLDTLRDVTAHARSTFDVRYTDGGIHGISANLPVAIKKAASLVGVPVAVVGPDVKLLRGRQAMVNVGSSSHGGTLFVGTDTRSAVHAGISATAAWSLAADHVSATAGLQVLPFVQDRSSPKGVMIRTRMNNLGPAVSNGDPGNPNNEPWRGKLLEVFDTVARSGPGQGMPLHKSQMWDALADKFFKDPDVSINWMETKTVNTSSSATATAGARAIFGGGYKAGLMTSAGASRFWSSKMKRDDTKGATKVQTIAHSSGSGVAVGAALVAGPKPLGDFSQTPGHVNQLVLPNTPLVGASVSLLTSSTGVTLRMAEDGGRILPDVTFRDIEFANVEDYLQYVDSRNTAWAASAAPRQGEVGQAELDTYLSEVKGNADRGNAIYAERQRMTPEAARTIDELREARIRFTPAGRPSPAQQARLDSLNARIEQVLNDDASWRNRFLFVMEANTRQRTIGAGYLLQAQTQTDVSHLRMTAALKAND